MRLSDISVKWKILAVAIVGPVVIAFIFASYRIADIRAAAEDEILSKSRAFVFMAEAARDEMAKKVELGIIKPLNEIPKENLVQAVPVVTAIQTVARNAKEGNFEFRVPKESPRNPANQPTELEKKVLDEIAAGGLTEKIIKESDKIRYFRPIKLSKDCLFCHGDPKGEKDPIGGTKEGWKEGEIHGAFEIISSLEEANNKVAKARITTFLWTAIIAGLIGGISWLFVKLNLISPLTAAKKQIDFISSGDLTRTAEVKGKDEFGQINSNLNEMAANIGKMIKTIREASGSVIGSASDLSDVSGSLKSSSESTLSHLNTVAAASEEMSVNMNSIAAAVEETSTNVSMVANSAEQMASTINEISRNTENAKSISQKAVVQADDASKIMAALGGAAAQIEKVTSMITDISEQTNLLALNATIEAARAGEAGKGFAVVASEIKQLAAQTVAATEEIKKRTEEIKGSTSSAASQISTISNVINDINDIVSTIAAAVEEQAATTKEIANNVVQASLGTQEVTTNVSQASLATGEITKDIAGVHSEAEGIASMSAQVNLSAKKLTDIALSMDEIVKKIKI